MQESENWSQFAQGIQLLLLITVYADFSFYLHGPPLNIKYGCLYKAGSQKKQQGYMFHQSKGQSRHFDEESLFIFRIFSVNKFILKKPRDHVSLPAFTHHA